MISLLLCALDAPGSSAFLFFFLAIVERWLFAIDVRLALKPVDNRSSGRLKWRLRPQPPQEKNPLHECVHFSMLGWQPTHVNDEPKMLAWSLVIASGSFPARTRLGVACREISACREVSVQDAPPDFTLLLNRLFQQHQQTQASSSSSVRPLSPKASLAALCQTPPAGGQEPGQ